MVERRARLPGDSDLSRLFKNVVYNLAGQGLVLILGFVGVKFIYGRLGADAFGIIYFNLVLTGVLTLALELGLLSTTVREVSAHYLAERPYVERLIQTASFFYWGLGVLLLPVLFFAAPFLVDRWINLRVIDAGTATTMLRFLSLTTIVMLPRAFYSSLFQGRQRMELNNSVDVTSSAIQQLGTIAILAGGGGAAQAVEWIAASAILSTLTYLAIAARLFGWRALVPGYHRDVVARNLRFTAHMGGLSILNMVLLQYDKVIVSRVLSIASVGYYSFAANVVARIQFATTAIAQAALPSFASLHQLADPQSLLLQYRKLQDLVCYGMMPLFAGVVYGTLPLFGYLLDRRVAWLLLLPTTLLCLGYYLGATISVPYTFSVAIGKPQIASRSNFLALFVVLPVTTLLVYRFGLAGAACSWLVYQLFLYVYLIPRISRECLHLPIGSWYAHVGKVAALAMATYGLLWITVVVPGSYGMTSLAVAYAGATVLFVGGALLLIGPDLRQTIGRLPRRLPLPGRLASPDS